MDLKKMFLATLVVLVFLLHLYFLLQFNQAQFYFEATLLVLLFILAFVAVFYMRNSPAEGLPFFFIFFGMHAFNMLIFERVWVSSFFFELGSYLISGLGILAVYTALRSLSSP